jgi:hypothetical protein
VAATLFKVQESVLPICDFIFNMAQKTTLQEFESVFPKLEEDLVAWAKQYNLPKEQLDWYKKVRLDSLFYSFSQVYTPPPLLTSPSRSRDGSTEIIANQLSYNTDALTLVS